MVKMTESNEDYDQIRVVVLLRDPKIDDSELRRCSLVLKKARRNASWKESSQEISRGAMRLPLRIRVN